MFAFTEYLNRIERTPRLLTELVQWTRVKTILSNVRFNYGPHSDIEVVGEEPPSA